MKKLAVIFLRAIPVIVLVILLICILGRSHLNKWIISAFACFIGGGIGNLIDRIAYCSVTYFFLVKLGFLKTGIFNMADVSVTKGVLLPLFLSFRTKKYEL